MSLQGGYLVNQVFGSVELPLGTLTFPASPPITPEDVLPAGVTEFSLSGDSFNISVFDEFFILESYTFTPDSVTFSPTAVPEPASATLLLGALGLLACRRRRSA